jgi:hypothetical protein
VSEPTTERLARDLTAAGAPLDMIERAREGYYDDFKSPLALPELQLYKDALAVGLAEIAAGVVEGRWDATIEESDAWAESPEGQAVFRELVEGARPNRAERRRKR